MQYHRRNNSVLNQAKRAFASFRPNSQDEAAVAERAVRAEAVADLAIRVGLGVSHALAYFRVQQLVSKAAMEALGAAVLPRTAMGNVRDFDTQLGQTMLDRLRNNPVAVIAANLLGHPVDSR